MKNLLPLCVLCVVCLLFVGCDRAQSRNLILAEETSSKEWHSVKDDATFRAYKENGVYHLEKTKVQDDKIVTLKRKELSKEDYGFAIYLMENLENIENRPEVVTKSTEQVTTKTDGMVTIKETESETVTERDISRNPQLSVHQLVLEGLLD